MASTLIDTREEHEVETAGPGVIERDGVQGDDESPVVRRAENLVARYAWAVTRLSIGFVFLWAFFDKLLALGYATGTDRETGAIDRFGDAAWINGGSPTDGLPVRRERARSRACSSRWPARPGPTGCS